MAIITGKKDGPPAAIALGYFKQAKALAKSAATREVLDRKMGACR